MLIRKPIILQLLRFAAIGALNTALDFIIFNYVTKSYNVTSGVMLGVLGVFGFIAAIVQSYAWNRAWAFHSNTVSSFQNAVRLFLVGGLGAAAFLAVVIGAANGALPLFYLLILAAFLISEAALWLLFGLSISDEGPSVTHQLSLFILVSLIGLVINISIIAIASHLLAPSMGESVNEDTVKNISKAMATGVSLIWNFMGYKLLVFKR